MIMQKKYKLQWKSFWGKFAFWLLGIPINIVPIVVKQINNFNAHDFPGVATLFIYVLGDLDFLFIGISVLFILCIEGFFADDDLIPIYHKFQLASLIYSVLLLIIYLILFYRNDLFQAMDTLKSARYNGAMIFLTIVLGALCNATISMKARVSA